MQLPNLTLGPNSVLPILVGGTVPGLQHDQYQITGTALLEGRLQLQLTTGYQPQLGDLVRIVQAENISRTFRSHFLPLALPAGFAIDFEQTPNFFDVRLVAPTTGNDLLIDRPLGNWNDATLWTQGEVSHTPSVVNVINQSTLANASVRVFGGPADNIAPARAHFVKIDGVANRQTTVEILGNGALSTTNRVLVGAYGHVVLDNGSLLSNVIDIAPQGRIAMNSGRLVSAHNSTHVAGLLEGNGIIEGNVTVLAGGVVDVDSPPTAPGASLAILGDYQQQANGALQLDVSGTAANQVEQLTVTGDADLGGTLTVDLTGFSNFGASQPVEIISAGTIAPTSRFAQIKAQGIATPGVYAAPVYDTSAVYLQAFFAGDMNRDSTVDEDDVDFFALALRNRSAYENFVLPDNSVIGISADITGDCDFDGDLDFDDIDDMVGLLSGPALTYGNRVLLGVAVPEPSTFVLLTIGLALSTVRR